MSRAIYTALSWVFWEEIALLGSGNIRPPTVRSSTSALDDGVFNRLKYSTASSSSAAVNYYPGLPCAPFTLPLALLACIFTSIFGYAAPFHRSHSHRRRFSAPRPALGLQKAECRTLTSDNVPIPLAPNSAYATLPAPYKDIKASPSPSSIQNTPPPLSLRPPHAPGYHRRRCPPPPVLHIPPPCTGQALQGTATTFGQILPLPAGLSAAVACLPTSQHEFHPAVVDSAHSISFSALQTYKPPTAFLCAAPLLSVPSGAAALFVGSHYQFHPPPVLFLLRPLLA
ncbi:hypothetical protein R3P38DRAFT_3175483 [Favolaschia claudopus]|uniref:Uncharacterized protein n=1 Tax=Favolaschia claudopus TaxID=2862362 RepID=A0AAW0D6Y3_9AGAR